MFDNNSLAHTLRISLYLRPQNIVYFDEYKASKSVDK